MNSGFLYFFALAVALIGAFILWGGVIHALRHDLPVPRWTIRASIILFSLAGVFLFLDNPF